MSNMLCSFYDPLRTLCCHAQRLKIRAKPGETGQME